MILIGLLFILGVSSQCTDPSCYTDTSVTALFQNIQSFGSRNVSEIQLSDYIQVCPTTQLDILSFTITLGTWTWQSQWSSEISTDPSGWTTSITLKLYNLDPFSNATWVTQNTLIPWRPQPSGNCSFLEYSGSDYRCHTVLNFVVTWNLNGIDYFVLSDFAFEITVNDPSQPGYQSGIGPWNTISVGTQTNVVNLVLNLVNCPINGF